MDLDLEKKATDVSLRESISTLPGGFLPDGRWMADIGLAFNQDVAFNSRFLFSITRRPSSGWSVLSLSPSPGGYYV